MHYNKTKLNRNALISVQTPHAKSKVYKRIDELIIVPRESTFISFSPFFIFAEMLKKEMDINYIKLLVHTTECSCY